MKISPYQIESVTQDLLEKGYSPQSLILEKDYPLGHKTKGKLDVLVNDEDGKAFLMRN